MEELLTDAFVSAACCSQSCVGELLSFNSAVNDASLAACLCAPVSHEYDLLYVCGAAGVKTVHLCFLTLGQ